MRLEIKHPFRLVLSVAILFLFGGCLGDDCGNEVGNGNEIVDGPSGPQGHDYDSVFRSLTVHPTDPDVVLMGTERNGFVKTVDGGGSWTRLRMGLRHLEVGYAEIWDVAFDPADPAKVYAVTLDSPGPVTGDYPSSIGGICKSTDGGETWSRTNCGIPSSHVTAVRIDGSDPRRLLVGISGGEATFSEMQGVYFDGGIYRSVNRGANWTKTDVGNANDTRNSFWRIVRYGPAGDRFVTFGFSSLEDEYDPTKNVGFLRSVDGGASWEPFGEALRMLLMTGFDVSQDGQVIYANERDSWGIRKSTDGGDTWTVSPINQANGPVAVSPADPEVVLYAAMQTLNRSDDGLDTWQVVLDAGEQIHDIVFAPSDPDVVYVATAGYLVYRSVDGGETFSFVVNIRDEVLNR